MVEGCASSKRWLSPWKDSLEKPAIYPCLSRVVDRRFAFEDVHADAGEFLGLPGVVLLHHVQSFPHPAGCATDDGGWDHWRGAGEASIRHEQRGVCSGGGEGPCGVSLEQLWRGGGRRDKRKRKKGTILPDLKLAAMLRCRVRCFTDGAVIGSKAFVNEAFAAARERFTEKRKDGARRVRGNGKTAAVVRLKDGNAGGGSGLCLRVGGNRRWFAGKCWRIREFMRWRCWRRFASACRRRGSAGSRWCRW